MKRGFSIVLACAGVLNLFAAAAGPLAQQPAATDTTATTTTPAPPAAPPQPSTPGPQGGHTDAHAASGGEPHPKRPAKKHKAHKASKVRAAGDPGVTIKDFSFGPSSITVHVGDTVTWTNNGPSPHTATGKGFDTGTLKKGQSGAHTFTQAGTFSYVCTIHPFMKGTVVVAAAGGSSPSGSSSSPSSSGPTAKPSQTAPAKPGLPNTGVDVGSLLLSGFLMLGAGLVLRRRAA